MTDAPEAAPAEAPALPVLRTPPEALEAFLEYFPPEQWKTQDHLIFCCAVSGAIVVTGAAVHVTGHREAALRLFAAAPQLVTALAQALDGTVARINRTLSAFDYDPWQPGDADPDLSELKADMRQQLRSRMDEATAMHAALVAAGAR